MKKIIICSVTILFNLGFSQTHRFIYELRYKPDSTSSKMDSVQFVLDVGREEVKFYELQFLKIDSIRNVKKENWTTNSETQQLVKRKLGSNIHQNYRDNVFDYFLIESKDEMSWKIFPDTKIVADFKLQKAETDFGGRHWIAWFNAEIPVNEGPYKFQGLPGLIFEIADTANDYSYKLVNSKKLDIDFDTSEFLETHYGNRPILTTFKKLNEVRLNYYYSPYSWAMTSKGNWSVSFSDGIVYNKKEDIPFLTKRMQGILRKGNNPIELDIAVTYPSN